MHLVARQYNLYLVKRFPVARGQYFDTIPGLRPSALPRATNMPGLVNVTSKMRLIMRPTTAKFRVGKTGALALFGDVWACGVLFWIYQSGNKLF